jgi:hypothetical protein
MDVLKTIDLIARETAMVTGEASLALERKKISKSQVIKWGNKLRAAELLCEAMTEELAR